MLIEDLKNWAEVSNLLYRYNVGLNAAYEIHVLYRESNTDIMDADASLYCTGYYRDGNISYWLRERLSGKESVRRCIEIAIENFGYVMQ